MKKILLLGGSGLLGTELRKLNFNIISPGHKDLDINSFSGGTIAHINPDIIINAAAVKDNRTIEQNPFDAVHTNIIGSAMIAMACYQLGIRYVYLSTDYIYKGDRGNYKETDEILPFNLYSWTKLGGECSARAVKNHLIIRTSFGPRKFEHNQAFMDKWTSKDYVEVIAPMILEAATSPLTGVLNLGTERKTLYDHASKLGQIKGVRLADSSYTSPYDTSFNLQKWQDYKSLKPLAKPHTNCRVCGSDKLVKYLDLGLMPLANNLEFTSIRAKQTDRFPLQVMFCESCGLSQLSVVIDPEKMYSYYTYRSGVNAPYLTHCYNMIENILPKYFKDHGLFHIDIAGNDGTLLEQAVSAYSAWGKDGYDVLNVDPASNLTAISEARGIPTINDFWSTRVAIDVVDKYGEANLITATNVFAHVDDIMLFLVACYRAMKDEGILIIECPYVIDFIDNMEFNQTYFEHLSYMSIGPMHKLCANLGLKIIEVEKQDIHGGTIRVTIAKDNSSHQVQNSVLEFLDNEFKSGFNSISIYKPWNEKVKQTIKTFGFEVLNLKKSGYKIACIAASAKGVTLLNACGINTDLIEYIVDDTPEKVGKFSPGSGIPIKNTQELLKNPPDYLIILSENFKDALSKRARSIGYKGKLVVGLPSWEIFD